MQPLLILLTGAVEPTYWLVKKARAAFCGAWASSDQRTVARPVLDHSRAGVTVPSLLLNLKPFGHCAALK